MQASQFLPGWTTSAPTSKPISRNQPYLHQTMSVTNFRDERTWDWSRAPSPSVSSSSSASRSATPTSNNPWASSASSVSSPASPGSPRFVPCPTPPSLSRCATPSTSRCTTPIAPAMPTSPIAPQPLNAVKPSFIDMKSPSARSSPTESPVRSEPPPTPFPSRDNGFGVSLTPLASAIITPALEKQYVHRESPTLISRQGWERSTGQRAYTWALGNSKTALLFLMVNDIAAWRRASFYWLEDSKLPFQEADLEGIASDPRRTVENQWRVMTKELPRNGQHVDYLREMVPLKDKGVIFSADSKTVDKVSWLGDNSNAVYVRKRWSFDRQAQKLGLLSQIQKLKSFDHPNIAKVVCSYSYGATVGFVTDQAQCTLDDYLRHPLASTQPGLLLNWINDLTQALARIHSMDTLHQSIRPQKILIAGPRILFSAFGVYTETNASSPRSTNSAVVTRPLSDQAYIFAAPEVVSRNKHRSASDVFSLGCVFLLMLTVVKGQTPSNFLNYRRQFTHDASFHANLDRVSSWRKLLSQIGSAGQRLEDDAIEHQVLAFVGAMLQAEPNKRRKMRELAPVVGRWNESRAIHRRRSFDGAEERRWATEQGFGKGSLISF